LDSFEGISLFFIFFIKKKIYPEDNLRHAMSFPYLKDLILIKIDRGKRINVDMAFVDDIFVIMHPTCMRN